MRSRWLLSVAACFLCAGLASAQPGKKPPLTSTGDPRVAVPAGLDAPTNKLTERAAIRGFADSTDTRTTFAAPVGRTLTQAGNGGRGYSSFGDQNDFKRAAVELDAVRDRGLLTLQSGDKVNKIADTNATGRLFATPENNRTALPATQVVPNNRHGIGDR